ncbi:hypothetical protein CPB83DRAFT_846914 [Crepidotus variabilis]|uniref:Store-operated calcium entry-associated regulatory factor n=1 Tax=Crepidotus variabilis TaxID=179855 RepID=A0A9P6EP45_9AGAR|nr:hypothetical protein CPB83DRAFT_846914 [Crepidotus variabilis]
MSKVELAKIRALTFYKDGVTTYKRSHALPQLVCVGKPCRLYQPEVVRCENLGGSGVEVDWKCEADLPEALRVGKVEVSCEGFSKPGDPYVLKGSCSLEYRLVQVPGTLLKTDNPVFAEGYDWSAIVFYVLWFALLGFIVYKFLASCLWNSATTRGTQPGSGFHRPSPGGRGPGWLSRFDERDSRDSPPPPYSKYSDSNTSSSAGWRPGFWTGAAVAGLANQLWNRRTNRTQNAGPEPIRQYDWERPASRSTSSTSWNNSPRQASNVDRGEGSSNLGSMRRSTGIGGSNVR